MKNYTKKAHRLQNPEKGAPESCIVIDSPHSGHVAPPDFDHAPSYKQLMRVSDYAVHRLVAFAPKNGIPLLKALQLRVYLDLNRDDDPEIKAGNMFRGHYSVRNPVPLYNKEPSLKARFNRIAKYYRPYYALLDKAIGKAQKRHGAAVHFDMHSMRSLTTPRGGGPEVPNMYDFEIGTRDGKTCDDAIVKKFCTLLASKGYRVGLNEKFKGRHLIETTGNPAQNRHSIQIEINRGMYMDEDTLKLRPGFLQVKRDLEATFNEFNTWMLQSSGYCHKPKQAKGHKPPCP
ncbi:MAG: N-formylglutamate amidohydrolase [Alphaproteobacteria bacterium]|nr:N-formylglutamate amidohydrolase [Alphaproteobacteria bacterium]